MRRYRRRRSYKYSSTPMPKKGDVTGFIFLLIMTVALYVIFYVFAAVAHAIAFVIEHWVWFTLFGLPTAIWLYKTQYPSWRVKYRLWRQRRALGFSKSHFSAIQQDETIVSIDRTEVYLQRITVDNLFTFIKIGISCNTENRDFLKSSKPVKKEVLDMVVFDTRGDAHAYEQQLLRALRQKGHQLDIELCQVYMKNGFTECFYDGSLERLPR